MMEDWAAACLNCGAVPRSGPNCPDCGTRLDIVPITTAITLTALQTMQRRRAKECDTGIPACEERPHPCGHLLSGEPPGMAALREGERHEYSGL